jgi:hypothetical protein
MLQLVISLEQILRYLNRAHPEKILVASAFYLMVLQLLKSVFKICFETWADTANGGVAVYTVCIIVQIFIALTAFSAFVLNKWLAKKGIDLDRLDSVPIVLYNQEKVSGTDNHLMNVTCPEDAGIEIY